MSRRVPFDLSLAGRYVIMWPLRLADFTGQSQPGSFVEHGLNIGLGSVNHLRAIAALRVVPFRGLSDVRPEGPSTTWTESTPRRCSPGEGPSVYIGGRPVSHDGPIALCHYPAAGATRTRLATFDRCWQ